MPQKVARPCLAKPQSQPQLRTTTKTNRALGPISCDGQQKKIVRWLFLALLLRKIAFAFASALPSPASLPSLLSSTLPLRLLLLLLSLLPATFVLFASSCTVLFDYGPLGLLLLSPLKHTEGSHMSLWHLHDSLSLSLSLCIVRVTTWANDFLGWQISLCRP